MDISESVKTIRRKALLSQTDFAKELGVSLNTVNRWENGRSKPTFRTMRSINDFCRQHGIDLDIREGLSDD